MKAAQKIERSGRLVQKPAQKEKKVAVSAILMAGGRGSRLGELTRNIPKPLLPVDNIPAMSRILRSLEKSGVRSATIATGYMADAIENRYRGIFRSIRLFYSREKEPLGTAGAVRAAYFDALSKGRIHDGADVMVMSADIIFEGDLGRLAALHAANSADVTVAAVIKDDVTGYGVITRSGNRIEDFVEKPEGAKPPSHLINAGAYMLSGRAIREIPEGRQYDFGRDLFPVMIQKGFTVCCCVYDDYWCDIGTQRSYYDCNMRFSGGENVIGNRCIIEPGAVVRGSVLFDGVTVRKNARVEGSIILDGAQVSEGAVVPAGSIVVKDEGSPGGIFAAF